MSTEKPTGLTRAEYVAWVVAQAPPLTEEQKAILRVLFRRNPADRRRPVRRAA